MSIDTIEEVNKNIDKIQHVKKFNPYHGSDGKFSNANGYATFTVRTKDPSKQHMADMAIARMKDKEAQGAVGAGGAGSGEKNETKSNQEQIDRVKRFEEELITELQSNIQPQFRDEFNTIHDLLNDDAMERDIQRVKTSVENNDKEEMKRLMDEFKGTAKEYAAPWFDEDLGYMREGYEWEANFYNKLADLCKSYQPTAKNYDHIEHVEKANPYHGADGRFTSANGGGGGSISPAARKLVNNTSEETKNEIRSILNGGGGGIGAKNPKAQKMAQDYPAKSISGTISSQKVTAAVERGGMVSDYEGKSFLLSPQSKGGSITAYIGSNTKSGGLKLDSYLDGFKDLADAKTWAKGTILNSQTKKSYDTIEEV